MKIMVYDIETAPLPRGDLLSLLPPFDPANVKLGNLKDEAKIAAKIKEAEDSHESDWIESATLSASTCTVKGVGIYRNDDDCTSLYCGDNEEEILRKFWRNVKYVMKDGGLIVSFGGNHFDLPMIINRSRIIEVPVPMDALFTSTGYLSTKFVDLHDLWKMPRLFTWDSKPAKLDYLCKVFGLPGKMEGVTGDMWHVLWETDRETALEYLRRDVAATFHLAKRMGAI